MVSVKLHKEARFQEYRPKFTNACEDVNKMLKDMQMWKDLQKQYVKEFNDGFNLSFDEEGRKVNLLLIYAFFGQSSEQLLINTYVPAWCFSRALAYTIPNSNVMFFNKNKFGYEMMTKEFIATIVIHEAVHIVDFGLEDYEFGHGGNRGQHTPEKKRSAPIWISNAMTELYYGKRSIAPKASLKERIMCKDYCETIRPKHNDKRIITA